jgi:hypothetical protein
MRTTLQRIVAKYKERSGIIDAALAVYAGLPYELRRSVDIFLEGVFEGTAQPLEKHADELYMAYAPARQAIASKHGSTVKVYRGEPKDKPGISRRFLSWTPSYDLAARFAEKKDFEVVEANVKVSDVVAVLVSPHRTSYIEYLVRDRKEYHTKGKALPLRGVVEVFFPGPWAPDYEAKKFTPERAEAVIKDIHSAMQAGKALVIDTDVDEENEVISVYVLVSPEVKIHKGDLGLGSTTIGDYEVENLRPCRVPE